MKFIEKLIEDTASGKLDFAWNFNEPDKYTYKQQFDPLTNMHFSLSDVVMKSYSENGKNKSKEDSTKGIIVFPNGASLEVDRLLLEKLSAECEKAVLRGMESLISSYLGGEIEANIYQKKSSKQEEKPSDGRKGN